VKRCAGKRIDNVDLYQRILRATNGPEKLRVFETPAGRPSQKPPPWRLFSVLQPGSTSTTILCACPKVEQCIPGGGGGGRVEGEAHCGKRQRPWSNAADT